MSEITLSEFLGKAVAERSFQQVAEENWDKISLEGLTDNKNGMEKGILNQKLKTLLNEGKFRKGEPI